MPYTSYPEEAMGNRSYTDRGYAAIFVDFENIFYYLQNEYADLPDLTEYALELLRNLRQYLEQELHLQSIVRYAYADFERLASAPLGSLYLMGIEVRNVLGTQHKNAADMRLCIDAMQVLYTRPDIRTFIFVAGDRDYIPVIQHIQTQARTVKAVAFRGNLSGDLLQNIGDDHFIDAHTLFDGASLKRLEKDAAYAREAARIREEARKKAQEDHEREIAVAQAKSAAPAETILSAPAAALQDGVSNTGNVAAHASGATRKPGQQVKAAAQFPVELALTNDDQRFCITFMLKEYGSHPEIWLSPFLRRLTDVMPRLADYERKNILHDLEQLGAIRVELRSGEPNDYRVIIVNYNHPDVRELNPG